MTCSILLYSECDNVMEHAGHLVLHVYASAPHAVRKDLLNKIACMQT